MSLLNDYVFDVKKKKTKKFSKDVIFDLKIQEKVRDNKLEAYSQVCKMIGSINNNFDKSKILKRFLTENCGNNNFKESITLFMKLLLPAASKRVYKLKNRQILNHFSKIFLTHYSDMIEFLKNEYIADMIIHFFRLSDKIKPQTTSVLTLVEVDEFLDKLSEATKDCEKIRLLEEITCRCTLDDLHIIIRLIKIVIILK